MEAVPDSRDDEAAVRVRGGRERLLRRVEEAFAAIPASLALTADQAVRSPDPPRE